jgi:glycogen operon protein
MERIVRPGRHAPLGATYDGQGVNFAVYSENASGMDVCLFDEHGEKRIPLRENTMHIWHGYIAGIKPGQRYGFRAKGPYEPGRGQLFNANKLLVDPYARSIDGKIDYKKAVFAFGESGTVDTRDDANGIPKGVVVDDAFDWEGDTHPWVHWADTVLYEAHVKGLTMRHPAIPEKLRGTYLGLAHDAVIDHLHRIGVTSIELLPIHESMNEHSVAARGRTNYWGYSTLGFFAPDQRFAAEPGNQVREFKHMVKRLHKAGIEVVLDVVYNHTGEGDHTGPCVSLRGLDNSTYYRLIPNNRARYEDYTGCGNSLNMMHPQTIKLVMDSLRYWVTEMHVDGFRFDLATTLAREVGTSVDRLSAFFDIIHQDPVLSNVKLIAEPWDLGQNGYQVGNFPVLWTEWNGRYRDSVRKFWAANRSVVGDMGFRLTGSSDLYEDDGRRPHASINFITAHDGFTLRDLVTYEKKRNLANGEDNRDGWDDNLAWNCGVEGPSEDKAINEVRVRQMRNFILSLIVSQGVPMLTAGDEIGKTQQGNNNAYAQDNEISWLDWKLDPERERFCAWVSELLAFRREHPVFRRPRFLRGERIAGSELPDIAWFTPSGREMTGPDWERPERAALALLLSGDALDWRDAKGENVVDDTFLILLNGSHDDVVFNLPPAEWGAKWQSRIDTAQDFIAEGETLEAGARTELPKHTARVYKRTVPVRGSWRPTRGSKGGF